MGWKTAANPKSELISLRLPADEMADLDAAVKNSKMASRSAYVRDCVRRVIAAEKRKAARLAGQGVE